MEHACNYRSNSRWARKLWTGITPTALVALREISELYNLSVPLGEVLFLDRRWYVTNVGLLRLAWRQACVGIRVEILDQLCDPKTSKWVFKAIVFTHQGCRGFAGYGDADPSNVSPLVHGAEMRVAETRAVNRALRKAYGIGICSVEELGSTSESHFSSQGSKKPSQPANGNCGSPKTRDRLCQLIRQHELDPTLVKAYAVDFCGTNTLREANREQVGNFVAHLAEWAEKDRSALVCHLKTYAATKEGAA